MKEGDIIDLGSDGPCVVEMINDCRARVRPVGNVKVEFTPVNTGKTISFNRPKTAFNISPNTEVPIIGYQRPKSKASHLQQ